jgi:protein-L-isoaspartate(D-aspartate) O-methyltransferase
MQTEQARFNMIEQQIRPWNVLDASVLSLLAVVKREDFVPAAHRALAFMDTEVPLPEGQSMLPPRVEARLLQELAVQRHERVLEIGTGSGYMAALLAHKALSVRSLEKRPTLVALARDNLKHAGVLNVEVVAADGSQTSAATQDQLWDVIVLSGSVAAVPQALLQALKPGGRLVAIVGQVPVMRAMRYTSVGSNSPCRSEVLFDTLAPRLEGFGEPTRFSF